MKPKIICENLSCLRPKWNTNAPAMIRDFSTSLQRGEFVGLCGPDGCGKGLALNVIGLIEKPDSGRLNVWGYEAANFSEEDAATFRNEVFGFLFGHPHLLPAFTVAENVAMPLFRICGGEASEARERTLEVLEFAGIGGFETRLVGRLDPALRWRAAFARSIVHQPSVLIAISPPAPDLVPLARRAADELDLTILWTGEHEMLRPFVDHIIEMREGHVVPTTI